MYLGIPASSQPAIESVLAALDLAAAAGCLEATVLVVQRRKPT
jgi:hypothetical protein